MQSSIATHPAVYGIPTPRRIVEKYSDMLPAVLALERGCTQNRGRHAKLF